MLIIMPLWLWLLILPLQITWRITMWSWRLTLAACRWSLEKGRSR